MLWVGLGSQDAGLSAAYMLQRDGMKVAVLEAGRIASGVTGYTTAKVTALHGLIYSDLLERHGAERAAAYAAANSTAIDLVRSIVDAEGIACELERQDAYTYAETDEGADAIRREAEACREIGLDAELVYDVPLPFPVSAAVRLRNQAQFHPRAYCLGLAAAIHGAKGRIYERTRVSEVQEKVRVCHVKTDRLSRTATTTFQSAAARRLRLCPHHAPGCGRPEPSADARCGALLCLAEFRSEAVNKSSRKASSARSRGASDETYQPDRRGASEHAGCAADLFTTSDNISGQTSSPDMMLCCV